MTAVEDTVLAYWDACEARDWERFAALLADDVVYHLPQTGSGSGAARPCSASTRNTRATGTSRPS
ncbi:nuclear transport factor 2 family protein [Micromonospora sp. URMC 103]|uniref:nuclear transport factor 2 family protein n=1 Tax=Micromonospora sp. URMC 103 TaxID=3423406 RepID=UPI003F1B3FE5